MDRVRSPWLFGFGLVAVAQLVFVIAPVSPLADLIAVSMLAPVLAVWVWRMKGPRVLVLALLFCAVGDVLGNPRRIGLELGGLVLSVAAFAVAQGCLMVLFVRRGALSVLQASIGGRQRWRSALALLYLVAAVVVFWAIWDGLGPAMRAMAGIYLLLLVGSAATALVLDAWAGIGVALFAGSVVIVSAGMVGWVDSTSTWHRLQVRLMYQLGLLLIAVAVVNRGRRVHSEFGHDPGA